MGRGGLLERSRICSDLCCGGRGHADHHGITASLIHDNLWISQVQVQVQAARCVYFKLVSPCCRSVLWWSWAAVAVYKCCYHGPATAPIIDTGAALI